MIVDDCGCVWMFMDVYGLWTFMDVYGLWIYGRLWTFMDVYGRYIYISQWMMTVLWQMYLLLIMVIWQFDANGIYKATSNSGARKLKNGFVKYLTQTQVSIVRTLLNTIQEELCHMTGSCKQNPGFRKLAEATFAKYHA